MKIKHLLLPLLTGLSLAASAMPHIDFLFSHSDEQRNLRITFPQSGPGFANSELQCSSNLTDWVTEADPPSRVDGSDYLVWRSVTARQEYFRIVSREPYAFNPSTVPGSSEFILEAEDGKMRRILVFIPEGYPNNPPAPPEHTGPVLCPPAWPLAIICHGSGQTSNEFATRHPDLITKCNNEGVILVIPQGTRNPIVPPHKHSWNTQENLERRDDVLFMIRLVERMKSILTIDDERTYIGGFSNGGVMSQLASVRTPRLFAAAAAVGSSAPSDDQMDPHSNPVCPAPGLPILLVNGKIDWARPFYGGGSCPLPTTPVGGVCPSPPILGSAPDMAAWWQGVNGCTGTAPIPTALPDYDPAHWILTWPGLTSTDVPQQIRDDLNASLPSIGTTDTWCQQPYPCPDVFEVNLVSVNAQGHEWPDAADNTGYDANEEVIDFFLSHRKVPVKDDGSFAAVPRTAGGTRRPLLPDSPDGLNLIYEIPAGAKAIVFVCHGSNQDATFVDCVEMTDTLDDLTAAGIGWIAFDSDVAGNWDLVNGLGGGNQDLLNAIAIRNFLIATGQFGPDRPLYTMGYDQGALFAILLGYTFELNGDPIKGVAQLCPDFDVTPPGATANAALNTALPHYLFVTECDHVADKLQAMKFYQRIRYRSQGQMDFSRLCVSMEKCPEQARFDRIVPAINSAGVMTVLDNQGFTELDNGVWRRDFCKDQIAAKLQALTFPPALGLTGEQEKEVRGQIRVMFAAHEPDALCAPKLTQFLCETLEWTPEESGDSDPQG